VSRDTTQAVEELPVRRPRQSRQIGVTLNRIFADAGHRGHNTPPGVRFKVYAAGRELRVTEHIGPQLRWRSAVKPKGVVAPLRKSRDIRPS
jgi:hypothetical protein